MSSVIGICGFQGSGKDTIGDILVSKYGYTRLSFASILKDIVAILFDWDRNMLEGNTPEYRAQREIVDEWWSKQLNMPNLTPRWVLQQMGTDVMRTHFHNDIWIIALKRKMLKYDKVVITDCRFENEISMLKSMDATIIHVIRGNLPTWFDNVQQGENPPIDLHPSEWKWIPFIKSCKVIHNDGTIDDLNDKVINILRLSITPSL